MTLYERMFRREPDPEIAEIAQRLRDAVQAEFASGTSPANVMLALECVWREVMGVEG